VIKKNLTTYGTQLHAPLEYQYATGRNLWGAGHKNMEKSDWRYFLNSSLSSQPQKNKKGRRYHR
ncbi:MAG TPA: hypothetical protein VJ969_05190, partial [Desulfopila sp.]|nr:hypothetical protein [Desulfopila sp.]